MIYNHKLGLHIRLKDSILEVLRNAQRYNVDYVQFFLSQTNRNSKYIRFSQEEQQAFIKLKNDAFSEVFIHSSYWINPSSGKELTQEISRKLLKQEIRTAQCLEIPYIVLHCGSATGYDPAQDSAQTKILGIQTLCSILNEVLKGNSQVKILLENTAHGNLCLGSDFQDFILIKQLLDYPEKVSFCVDFSHAFSFGYNLENTDEFLTILEKSMGLDSIKLIHFNDSLEPLGSKKDRHAFPGQGIIGTNVLQELIKHPALCTIPKVIEVPLSEPREMNPLLSNISAW